jgi:hypothetical protein
LATRPAHWPRRTRHRQGSRTAAISSPFEGLPLNAAVGIKTDHSRSVLARPSKRNAAKAPE